jgi:hypothetical protein
MFFRNRFDKVPLERAALGAVRPSLAWETPALPARLAVYSTRV